MIQLLGAIVRGLRSRALLVGGLGPAHRPRDRVRGARPGLLRGGHQLLRRDPPPGDRARPHRPEPGLHARRRLHPRAGRARRRGRLDLPHDGPVAGARRHRPVRALQRPARRGHLLVARRRLRPPRDRGSLPGGAGRGPDARRRRGEDRRRDRRAAAAGHLRDQRGQGARPPAARARRGRRGRHLRHPRSRRRLADPRPAHQHQRAGEHPRRLPALRPGPADHDRRHRHRRGRTGPSGWTPSSTSPPT